MESMRLRRRSEGGTRRSRNVRKQPPEESEDDEYESQRNHRRTLTTPGTLRREGKSPRRRSRPRSVVDRSELKAEWNKELEPNTLLDRRHESDYIRRSSKSERRISSPSRDMMVSSLYDAQARTTEGAENLSVSKSYPDITTAISATASRPPPSSSPKRVTFSRKDGISPPRRYSYRPSRVMSEPVASSRSAPYYEETPEYEPVRTVRSSGSFRTSEFAHRHVEPASVRDEGLSLTRSSSRDEEQVVAILVIGLTGSGKSAFISLLADKAVVVGNDLTSSTVDITGYRTTVKGRKIILIDTPGFDDTYRTDADILENIVIGLASLYQSAIKLIGVLYFHRITDIRMSGAAKKSKGILERLCGPPAFRHIVVVTNMWQHLQTSEEGYAREKELMERPEYFRDMVEQGTEFKQHYNNTKESAEQVVSYIIKKGEPFVLAIQRQLVDENMSLEATPVGEYINEGIVQLKRKRALDLKRSQEELQRAMDDGHEDQISDLKLEIQQQHEELDKLNRSLEGLRTDLLKLADRKRPEFAKLLRQERPTEDEDEVLESRLQLAAMQAELQRLEQEHARIAEEENWERKRHVQRMSTLAWEGSRVVDETPRESPRERKIARKALKDYFIDNLF